MIFSLVVLATGYVAALILAAVSLRTAGMRLTLTDALAIALSLPLVAWLFL